jgi:uncharacterized membrane protein YccC
MNDRFSFNHIRRQVRAYRAQLRFCVRMTASGLAAFGVAKLLNLPLHGLWMILTAIVVTQISAGGSLRATVEYTVGTVGGAVYAAAIGVLIPHTSTLAQAAVLALAIAPLALAAAINPNFRVAPFSAVLVLLIAGQFGEGPIQSAITRSSEVAMGGVIAVIISLLVFPERAYQMRLRSAEQLLRQLARDLPRLLAAFTQGLEPAENRRIQNDIGAAVADLYRITAEAEHELMTSFAAQPHPAPLARTMLRLRHDLVILGRAGADPLPDTLGKRLAVSLDRVGAAASDFLAKSAAALERQDGPPPLDAFETALAAYTTEVDATRSEGLTLPLTSREVEPVFALGFALEQLHHNFIDLRRSVQAHSRHPRRTNPD